MRERQFEYGLFLAMKFWQGIRFWHVILAENVFWGNECDFGNLDPSGKGEGAPNFLQGSDSLAMVGQLISSHSQKLTR